jgi:uncharacterized membrane protein YbjE (DUF340 family)
MFVVLLFMFAGIIFGYLLRKWKMSFANRIILTLIWLLLFLLGVEVGANDQVVRHFHKLGYEAFLIAVFATLGSVIGAKILWHFHSRNRKDQLEKPTELKSKKSFVAELKGLQGSVIILLFFGVGLLFGIFRVLPVSWLNYGFSFYVLAALMFSVGFSLGHQPDTIRQFRSIHSVVLLLPFSTILGTWLGVAAISFLSEHSIFDYLAIGSGLGYYSLSSILITEYKGAELGTIALLANIFREIITLVLAPLMVRYFGKLAPIAAGGATTMDTTFPIIIKTSGKEFSIVSIYHGFVTDFSVPFFVTLWCGLKL